MNNKINTFISKYLLLLGLCLIFTSQSAHADFRKAVDAYIARDGSAMLKEVNDAVEKKNNEGLALFISAMNIDASTSRQRNLARIRAGNRANVFVDEAEVKTTLSTILTEQQKNELIDALRAAVENSNVDMQYSFATTLSFFKKTQQNDWRKLQEEFAKKGAYISKLQSTNDLLTKAELGDFASQLSLGFKYLNYTSDMGLGCWEASKTKEAICQAKDEAKGYYWLKQALKTTMAQKLFAGEGAATVGLFADTMCDFFHRTANGDAHKLRQAYLWCVVGINSGGGSWSYLNKMHEAGTLKIAAPEIEKIWGTIQQDRDRLFKTLNQTKFTELPDWMIEAQKELPKKDLPAFSYYFADYRVPAYLLDIYPDGRVVINDYSQWSKGSLLVKVSPNKVKSFLKELKKLDFKNWTLFNTTFQFCDNFDPCIWSYVKATQFEKGNARTVLILEPPYLAEYDYDGISTLRTAKLQTLVEKYFPTRKIRCELSGSEGYRAACIARDERWAILAKRTSKEKKPTN